MAVDQHPPVDPETARKAAEFYRDERFAITWTQSRNGGNAKAFTTKGWHETRPLVDVADFVKRAAYANPGIVLRGSRLIGVELDGIEQIERFEALGIPRAGMRAQSSTPERLHYFYDWPRSLGDEEPVSFRFEDEAVTAVTNNAYVCPPGTHPKGERKWLNFERTPLTEAEYKKLIQVAGRAKRSRRKAVANGEKVAEGGRHGFLVSETGRLRAQGLSEADALAALIGIDALSCEPPLSDVGRGDELRRMVDDIYQKDPLPETPTEWRGQLAPLLEATRKAIRRFVVVGDAESYALALHAAHTHAFGAAEVTPYIEVRSAEKRCGKSTLLKVLASLVARPRMSADMSDAVLYRLVSHETPTLLWDEVDAIFGKNAKDREDTRKLLNAGFEAGPRVLALARVSLSRA